MSAWCRRGVCDVATIHGGSSLARAADALLLAVAVDTVIAIRIVLAIVAGVSALIAKLTGARIASGLAVKFHVTRFGTVAEQGVIAVGIVRDVIARVGALVAGIVRAADAVITVGGRAR